MSLTIMTLQSAPLDVEDVDEYLCQLLLPRILASVEYFPQVELNDKKDLLSSILQALLLYASLGQTPATRALGLTMENSNKRKITILIFCSVILPAIYRRINGWYRSTLQGVGSSTNSMNQLYYIGFQRRQQVTKRIVQLVEPSLPLMNLLFLLSWWSNKSKSHTLPLFLSGLSYTSTTDPKHLNVGYAYRRWGYEEMVKCFRVLSPVTGWADVPRIRRTTHGEDGSCPICKTASIVIPFTSNCCQRTYCYTCLWQIKSGNMIEKTMPSVLFVVNVFS